MGVALGLPRPFLYGSSGFAGGLATRRLPLATVNMIGGTTATIAIWAAPDLRRAPRHADRLAGHAVARRPDRTERTAGRSCSKPGLQGRQRTDLEHARG
jgi:hypothetical protein